MTTNNSILIFHRSKNNSEEDLINQQTFLDSHPKIASSSKIIDYVTGDYHQAREIFELMKAPTDPSMKMIVILHSFLSEAEYNRQYKLYSHFEFLRKVDVATIYLMDSKGKLYKEIEHIEK